MRGDQSLNQGHIIFIDPLSMQQLADKHATTLISSLFGNQSKILT